MWVTGLPSSSTPDTCRLSIFPHLSAVRAPRHARPQRTRRAAAVGRPTRPARYPILAVHSRGWPPCGSTLIHGSAAAPLQPRPCQRRSALAPARWGRRPTAPLGDNPPSDTEGGAKAARDKGESAANGLSQDAAARPDDTRVAAPRLPISAAAPRFNIWFLNTNLVWTIRNSTIDNRQSHSDLCVAPPLESLVVPFFVSSGRVLLCDRGQCARFPHLHALDCAAFRRFVVCWGGL